MKLCSDLLIKLFHEYMIPAKAPWKARNTEVHRDVSSPKMDGIIKHARSRTYLDFDIDWNGTFQVKVLHHITIINFFLVYKFTESV